MLVQENSGIGRCGVWRQCIILLQRYLLPVSGSGERLLRPPLSSQFFVSV